MLYGCSDCITKGKVVYLIKENEAKECFLKAIEINKSPNDSSSYFSKALSFYGLKKFHDSIHYFDKAIELDPNYVDAILTKGVCLSYLQRVEEEILCYEKAIEINPKYVLAHHNRGKVLKINC